MNFEEFEKKILEKGFGIVGMNHYYINKKPHLFCAVMNTPKQRAFKTEGEKPEEVFENLYNQIIHWENKNKPS